MQELLHTIALWLSILMLIDLSHPPQAIENLLLGPVSALANKHQLAFNQIPLKVEHLDLVMQKVKNGALSSKMAKDVIEYVWNEGLGVEQVIESTNSNSSLPMTTSNWS